MEAATVKAELVSEENFGEKVIYPNNTATLIGAVKINGEAAAVGDVVAVFVGEELRGKFEIENVFQGVAYAVPIITCKGGDETATFKVYDASANAVFDVPGITVTISPGAAVGGHLSPVSIEAIGEVPSDETAPVITLTGDATVSVEAGGSYSDDGATASDDSDGDLTGSIAATSTVDASKVGSYTVS